MAVSTHHGGDGTTGPLRRIRRRLYGRSDRRPVDVDRDSGDTRRRRRGGGGGGVDVVFVGQRHAPPVGLFGGVASRGGKTGGPADGHRVRGRREPEAAPAAVRVGRRLDAGEADGALDRRPAAARRRRTSGRARQPRLQYGLVAERDVTVNMVVRVVVAVAVAVAAAVTPGRRHGSGPVTGMTVATRLAAHLEPVATVLVAVAVLAVAAFPARVPRLAGEHRDRRAYCVFPPRTPHHTTLHYTTLRQSGGTHFALDAHANTEDYTGPTATDTALRRLVDCTVTG